MGTGEYLGQQHRLLRWTDIQSRGSSNTSSRFVLQTPELPVSDGSYRSVGPKTLLRFPYLNVLLGSSCFRNSAVPCILNVLYTRYLRKYAFVFLVQCSGFL